MTLGIHIIGPGFGESIVLEFPDHSIGIVDTYSNGRRSEQPIVEFIESTFPSSVIRFLALTHPHADHCLGATELVRRLSPERLLVFNSIVHQELRSYLIELKHRGLQDVTEAALDAPVGTLASEVFEIVDELDRRCKKWKRGNKQGPKPFALLKPGDRWAIDCGTEQCIIRCLTPGDGLYWAYARSISNAVKTSLRSHHHSKPESGADSPNWKYPHVNPNLISSVLVCEYGTSQILLMADAEESTWLEWLSDGETNTSLEVSAVNFLKLAHHGSENGYSQKAFQKMCKNRPLAIVTPFNKQKNQKLPSSNGIEKVTGHVSEILCTNRMEAERSSGLEWERVSPSMSPETPMAWLSAIADDRQLTTLLAESRQPPSRVLPVSWWRDCIKNPILLHLLNPDIPEFIGIAGRCPAHQLCRISVYFNDKGEEDTGRRVVGPLAGRLKPAKY